MSNSWLDSGSGLVSWGLARSGVRIVFTRWHEGWWRWGLKTIRYLMWWWWRDWVKVEAEMVLVGVEVSE